MNNNTYIMLAGVMILVVGVMLVAGYFSSDEAEIPVGTLDGDGGPFGGSPIIDITPGAGSPRPGDRPSIPDARALTIQLAEGELDVVDVTKYPFTATSTDGTYFEFTEGNEASLGYELFYFPQDTSFIVSIQREPIGEIRKIATQDLINKLGILPEDVCSIRAQVTLIAGVSEVYRGYSLGFPGCPGARALPGD